MYHSYFRFPAILLSVNVLVGLLAVQAQAEGVSWRRDLDSAKVEAAQSGRLVLIHFWSPTCGPCRGLEQNVFNQPQVGGLLERDFVPVKVNTMDSPALASAFQIDLVPTDVVLTSQGRVISKLTCPPQPADYLQQLAGVAGHYRETLAAGADPSGQTPVHAAYAGLQIGGPAPPAGAAMTAAPVAPPAAAPPVAQAAAAPAPQIQVVTNPYASLQPQQPQQAAVTQAPAAPASSLVDQLPPGCPPLAFDGCSPVYLSTHNQWKEGNPKIGAIHRGQTFLFVDETERAQFLANPDAYSPVFSGLDPVLLLDVNQAVPGLRRFGYRHRGAFYLFSSAETKAKFADNADGYAGAVRMAMNRVDAGQGTVRR